MLFIPQSVGCDLPGFCRILAAAAEFIHILGMLEVCGSRAGGVNHGRQALRIVKERAGPEKVLVEGLIFAVFHKQRGIAEPPTGTFP